MSPQILYDAEGNKKEVPTEDEIKAQTDEATKAATQSAKDAFDLEKDDLKKEIDDLGTKLKTAEEKGAKEGVQTPEEKEKNKKEIEDLRTEINQKSDALHGFVVGGAKDEFVVSLAGDDDELKEAINANYARISGPETTKQEIEAKVREAYAMTLAQAGIDPNAVDLGGASAGGGGGAGGEKVGAGPKPKLSSEANTPETLKNFGLTQQDVEKFSPTK